MAAYLVVFRVNADNRIPALVRELAGFQGWTRLAENSFVVISDQDAYAIYDRLAEHVGKYDRLYVMRLGAQYAGQGASGVSDWLAENLLV